jgi:hypothetical protein
MPRDLALGNFAHAIGAARVSDSAPRSQRAASHLQHAAVDTPVLRSAGSVAVVVLCEVAAGSRAWGYLRFILQRWPLRHTPGLRLAKMLGSGRDGGFGLQPSGSRQGLFLGFDDEISARCFIDHSPVLAAYRAHASELCVALLRATSSKGSWSGAALETTAEPPTDRPIATLTRASIKLRHAAKFWRMAPPAEAALAAAPGCLLAVGLGEAPLLRQATFTVWSGRAAMDNYARSGAHLEAIRAAYAGQFFSESMFVRFTLLQLRGVWKGQRHGD